MMIECATVVFCVLIICFSICYCNPPSKPSKNDIRELDNILIYMKQSLVEIKENTYYIDRKLEQFKEYLMDEDNQSKK